MFYKTYITAIALTCNILLFAQNKKLHFLFYPDSIVPVGIFKGLSDDQLLEVVQKQTFRFFWHGAHPGFF